MSNTNTDKENKFCRDCNEVHGGGYIRRAMSASGVSGKPYSSKALSQLTDRELDLLQYFLTKELYRRKDKNRKNLLDALKRNFD